MIRTILFDMGNVLIYFSHQRMCEQLGRLIDRTETEVNSWLLDSGLQWDYERGKINPRSFHGLFQDWGQRTIEEAVLHRAGSDIFTPNDEILPVLKSLKSAGYRLVLMSNTNEVHFNWVRSEYPVLEGFDDFVLSYEVGAMKPEPAIFEAAMSKIACAPHECFYTDDIPEYIAAARKLGFDAEVFTGVTDLKQHLARRNVPATIAENH
ncbi:MAG: HAD family phosphatase [Planctomycetaceae bacterium]